MKRPMAAIAMCAFAIAGCADAQPSPTPSIDASATAAETVAALQSLWESVGDRESPGDWGVDDNSFNIDSTGLRVEQVHGDVLSTLSVTEDGSRLVLTFRHGITTGIGTTNQQWRCQIGDEGVYDVRLTPTGRTLTLGLVSDPCAPRAAFLPGAWTRSVCKPGYYACAPSEEKPSLSSATPSQVSPLPSRQIDGASPESLIAAGCDDSGNCRLRDVGLWHAVPFTPSIRCGLSGETCQLHFEIYAPTSGGPWPLIVLEPGGNVAPGEPGDYLDQMATALAGRGAVVMVGQWRQSSQWAGRSPDSFADVACAIGVARRIGPALRANPDRVVLVGHSMSTRPVAVIGLTDTAFTPAPGMCDPTAGSLRPDGWADLAGPRDDIATASSGDRELVAFFGGTREADPAAWAAGDPFALAAHRASAATDLPIVLVQGGADAGAAEARAFQAALEASGHHGQLIEIRSADHFGTTVAKESIDAVLALSTAR